MKVQRPTVDNESKNLQLCTCAHNTLDKNDNNIQETVPEVQENFQFKFHETGIQNS